MTTAAYLLLYGVLVALLAPPVLVRLTRRGLSPRLGVAAWLTAIGGVLLAWTAAVALLVTTTLVGLPHSSTLVLCLELLGVPERVATPGRLGSTVLIAAGLLTSTVVVIKVFRSVVSSRSRSHEHARAARIIGAPTDRPDVFVISAQRPAAYCVVGRPHAIVVTSAAVDRLDDSQLAAVLAHEDAHIAGRHHHLLMVLRALAHSLTRLPLFTRGHAAIAELLEMCADDSAARRHGTRSLIAGMISLAGPQPVPEGLAVASNGVIMRANRLLAPAQRGTKWCHQVAVAATIAATVSAPIVINVICHH
jgi:Zn-dependent protease with chaperone function